MTIVLIIAVAVAVADHLVG